MLFNVNNDQSHFELIEKQNINLGSAHDVISIGRSIKTM